MLCVLGNDSRVEVRDNKDGGDDESSLGCYRCYRAPPASGGVVCPGRSDIASLGNLPPN